MGKPLESFCLSSFLRKNHGYIDDDMGFLYRRCTGSRPWGDALVSNGGDSLAAYHRKYYPYNPGNFRFLGDPVDGIQFEDDAILFIRFKTDDTPRTPEQDRIKRLVEQKNVRWFEFMMK
jgi:hypothetical protein